jgi:hypothetical protein
MATSDIVYNVTTIGKTPRHLLTSPLVLHPHKGGGMTVGRQEDA